LEIESNNTLQTTNVLPVGGYLVGVIPNPATDIDVLRVQIPASGTYTFETEGLFSSCAYALEGDTMLELLSSNGAQVAFIDDIDTINRLHCSRLSVTLSPGTYYLRVLAYTGVGSPGLLNRRYTVSARAGP